MSWVLLKNLVELWRLRRRIVEAKSEISVSSILAKYTYRAGEAILNKTVDYRSTYMTNLFKATNKAVKFVSTKLCSPM